MDDFYSSDIDEELDPAVDKSEEFESSFTYHAVPLDEIRTLDEYGIEFSLQELSDLNDLSEE